MSGQVIKNQMGYMKKILSVLGSYTLGIVLMGILLVLTFYGTIYQTMPGHGMSAAQAAESFFGASYVLIPLGGADALLALPLPGMWIVSCALFVNLLIGGVIAARKGVSKWGVLISHIGILVLLAAVALGNRFSEQIESINLVPGHVYRNDSLDFGIKLHKFTPEFYPGTGKAKSFESDISIVDEQGAEKERALIRMNEPLRYRGWTFYQMSYNVWDNNHISILSGVRNPFDEWPKWASYVISFGLLLHFGAMFLCYLRGNRGGKTCGLSEPEPDFTEEKQGGDVSVVRKKWILAVIGLFIVGVFGVGLMSGKPHMAQVKISGYVPWSSQFVEEFGRVGVEDGGRVKPFSTYAGFSMLKTLGKRSLAITTEEGKYRISPTEWLLDCIFRSEYSDQMPVFLVNREEVVQRLELPQLPDKRKRYTYSQLAKNGDNIFTLAAEIQKSDSPSDVDRDILSLALNMWFVEQRMGMVADMLQDPQSMDRSDKQMPRWFKGEAGEWRAIPSREVAQAFALASIDAKRSGKGNDLLYKAEQKLTAGFIKENRESLSEGEKAVIGRESLYYKIDPLYGGLILFVAAFVLLLSGSLLSDHPSKQGGKLKQALFILCGRGIRLPWVLACLGVALLAFGMILRVMITMRSPVGNTFETILFIACSGVLITLIIEAANKRGIALVVGLLVGAAGCQMGMMYEAGQASDHMDPLVAVLRSNFLLSTHVITIVLGYASALLAGVFSHIYVLSKPFNIFHAQTERTLTRMAYGTLCFSLLFTLIGTVFGGIWGNEAWGRFWGWDPKENGALIIILWQLMLLHGRLAGYAREWGLHIGNIIGVLLIAFAWWGVNTLGVGLHSYGFSDAYSPLRIFYVAETVILIASLFIWWRYGRKKTRGQAL